MLFLLLQLRLEEARQTDAAELVVDLEHLADVTGWLEGQALALRARATADRDIDVALEHARLAEREGWTVEGAHAALLLGELGHEPGRQLANAYKLYEGFGAAPLRRRAAAALRARGLSVPRRPVQRSSPLTETEVQLIKPVRDGLSNRQIATAMHYSAKTIEVYLPRVYAKTAYGSRLELIRAVDTGAITLE